VGPYLISRHLPICEDGQEGIGSIVGERAAIVRKDRRTRRVIGYYFGQHCPGQPLCVFLRIPSCVLQCVCETGRAIRLLPEFENSIQCRSP
jgi:hypothetical protein